MKRWIVAGILLLVAACSRERNQPPALGGDVARGKELVATKYGCNACHVIPGIEGARGMVGPPLDHIAQRQVIGGKIENTPQNMAKWIQDPQLFDPGNAMPKLGVTDADARDITAFLNTLK